MIKLKEELDHTRKELMLTTEKLNKFEKITENMDEFISNQRSLDDKIGLVYNNSLNKIDTYK